MPELVFASTLSAYVGAAVGGPLGCALGGGAGAAVDLEIPGCAVGAFALGGAGALAGAQFGKSISDVTLSFDDFLTQEGRRTVKAGTPYESPTPTAGPASY